MGVNYWIYFIAGAFAVTKTSSSPTDCLVSFSQDCFIDVKCTQRIYFNIYNDYYSRSSCLNLLYYNGVYYKPIHLSYRNFDNTNNLINWNNINYELKNMIVTFDLSNNQLQSQPALGIMENLKVLNLSYNNLTVAKLSDRQLYNKLTEVDFSYNAIKDIKVYSSENIYNELEKLDLSNNILDNIPETVFDFLSKLEHLNLSNNHLTSLNLLSFIGLKNLQNLQLAYNQIVDIESSKLQSVKLTGTSTDVSLIHVNDTQLIDLDISHAHIKNLTNRSFDNFTHLEKLVLTYNEISTVNKDSLIKLNNLQFLDLSSNQLKFLQPGTFKNNYNLKLLNISHNSLIDLNYGTLRGLVSLDILDLSFNYIENLEKDIFSETESLKSLIVDNNRIKSLNSYELIDLHISKLSIGDNPIPCKQIVQLKKKVSFDVTSLRYDEHRENVKGVTCNERNPTIEDHHPSQENNDSKRIYDVLKEIFTNSSRSDSINERSKVDNQKARVSGAGEAGGGTSVSGNLVKMKRFTGADRAFCVREFYKNYNSATVARRIFREHKGLHNFDDTPTLQKIKNWVAKFEETGSTLDKPRLKFSQREMEMDMLGAER
ncbi:chaoptin-like [Battus philenor]|uniref:chaoptin-like n=1 Tax=Battus philenor TaxID=42288 RepID=UPI0035D0CEED